MSFKLPIFIKFSVIGLLISTSFFSNASASPNPSGVSGQYSCVMNRQIDAYSTNLSGASNVGVRIISYFDFSKNSGSMLFTLVDNFGIKGTVGSQKTSDFTFTEVKYASIPNTYILTVLLIDGSTVDFFSMPVNSGNTLLINSGGNISNKAPWSGVCQKI